MTHAFGSIDELGEGYGFRKVRRALGVDAFGVNVIVMPPRYEGFQHYHDEQDELYFVHAGTARVDVDGDERLLGPGGMVHVTSTTPRRISNAGDEDLVLFVVGGKGGYVERDGHMVDDADVERRRSFGSGDRFTASTRFRSAASWPQMHRRRSEQYRQDNEGAPIDRHQSKDEPQAPPIEPGFDGKRDAADEKHRRQGRVKAKQ